MAYEVKYIDTNKLNNDVAIGIQLPLSTSDGRLFALSYSTHQQTISNLKNLVLTRKGERIMQPRFGTDLYDSLFENITDTTITNIKTSISEAVNYWMPYVNLDSINVQAVEARDKNTNRSEHGITVSINISVNGFQINEPVSFLITSNIRQTL
jgi:phage baseplate assembly protein W